MGKTIRLDDAALGKIDTTMVVSITDDPSDRTRKQVVVGYGTAGGGLRNTKYDAPSIDAVLKRIGEDVHNRPHLQTIWVAYNSAATGHGNAGDGEGSQGKGV